MYRQNVSVFDQNVQLCWIADRIRLSWDTEQGFPNYSLWVTLGHYKILPSLKQFRSCFFHGTSGLSSSIIKTNGTEQPEHTASIISMVLVAGPTVTWKWTMLIQSGGIHNPKIQKRSYSASRSLSKLALLWCEGRGLMSVALMWRGLEA